jgi:hypothetical protein
VGFKFVQVSFDPIDQFFIVVLVNGSVFHVAAS